MHQDRYQHISDNTLLERFYAEKDNHWLGILLQRYTMLLFGVCMKYLKNEDDARDGVQQIFLKAIAEMHKYKVAYFKSWIYMVAKNHCLMRLRDRHGKVAAALNEETMMVEAETTPVQAHIDKDRVLDAVATAIEELNNEQKQCVTLFYLNKKSYTEIAETTGYSMMQVKSYIQNGKRNLKIAVERIIKQS
ncbi:MAG TPA: sigma-70 family RNA polymerase sigma factor [Chitinophagaceae bacterium]|nr:sigma-70 family RNA polymerase sigma factor [Chitinophagaceae bacterium]